MKKTRVVLDTNIFLSALLGSKKARFLIKEILSDEYQLVMSDKQIDEMKDVLCREKFNKVITKEVVDELMFLLQIKIITPVIYSKINDCRDVKDNFILEEAVYGKAKYILTGDKDLLELNPYKGIQIITMNEFIKEKYDI